MNNCMQHFHLVLGIQCNTSLRGLFQCSMSILCKGLTYNLLTCSPVSSPADTDRVQNTEQQLPSTVAQQWASLPCCWFSSFPAGCCCSCSLPPSLLLLLVYSSFSNPTEDTRAKPLTGLLRSCLYFYFCRVLVIKRRLLITKSEHQTIK